MLGGPRGAGSGGRGVLFVEECQWQPRYEDA